MSPLVNLAVVPVVLPLIVAALLLVAGDGRRRMGSVLNIAATVAGLAVAVALLARVDTTGEPVVFLAANWSAPFGIVLVADRLAAMMLVLVGIVATGAALYAAAGWSRAGAYFTPLFQMQLAGLNGAFLTGDLFNLFVFFEVMLAASYGLQLHGSGWPRVRSGLHYVAVNLLASLLFLIGLAVLYGVMGTLTMADVADKMPLVPESDRGLLHVGIAILAMAFLVKAAIWPLNAWLVPAYTATSVPVAALFVLMTKVGVYALLRLWTLFFPAGDTASEPLGGPVLLAGGLATLAFGAAGVLASIRLDRIAAFSVIVSAGTLMAAIGMGSERVLAAALSYLVIGTLAVSALFLLVELVQRTSSQGGAQQPETDDAAPDDAFGEDPPPIGRVVPVSVAALGLAYMTAAVLVAGLPPLAGFVAKAALLTAMLGGPAMLPGAGIMIGLLLASGLCALVSLVRAGVRHFWAKGGRFAPRIHGLEAGAVLAPLLACAGLTVFAEPLLRYAADTAAGLHAPRPYVDAVLSAEPRPGPTPTATANDEVRP